MWVKQCHLATLNIRGLSNGLPHYECVVPQNIIHKISILEKTLIYPLVMTNIAIEHGH